VNWACIFSHDPFISFGTPVSKCSFYICIVLFWLVIEVKKLISIFAIVVILSLAVHCVSAASEDVDIPGPAPNSGDGIPDGPGFETEPPFGSVNGPGPAPNAGDGVSDGSGF
jgi:hypothetical protein